MVSLVYLTTRAPSQLAADLEMAGYKVFEALAVSEVLHLCEHQQIDAIVIGPDVEDPDLIEVQTREITITRKSETTVKELVWELSNLFQDGELRIQ
jgi:hypothetical protein